MERSKTGSGRASAIRWLLRVRGLDTGPGWLSPKTSFRAASGTGPTSSISPNGSQRPREPAEPGRREASRSRIREESPKVSSVVLCAFL